MVRSSFYYIYNSTGRDLLTLQSTGKDVCDAHGAIAHRKVIRYLRSWVYKADYRKVCTPKELAEAIANNGGLQNGGVQLLMLDRDRLDEIEEVIAEVSTAAKEYFSCEYILVPPRQHQKFCIRLEDG
jgi:hypothetical protein